MIGGQMSISDAAQDNAHFQRPALRDQTSQIRLLKLLPGPEGVDLQCILGLTSFETAPPYVAISYTWGQPEPKRPITINRSILHVNQNCYDALWQLRHHDTSLHIWIDSICIDQDNAEEKSSQVQMMAKIYKQAEYVAACVGVSAEADPIGSLVSGSESAARQDLEAAHEHLSQQPYWSRLWIVQELHNAKLIFVFCGKHVIPWEKIMSIHANSRVGTERIPLSRLVDHWNLLRTTGRLLTLETALYDYRNWLCADTRDHVYGLLGVVEADTILPPISPDYSKPVSELATAVAIRCMYLASQETFVRVGRLDLILDIFDLSFIQRCEINDQVARQLTTMGSNHRLLRERRLFLEATSAMRQAAFSHYGESPRFTQVRGSYRQKAHSLLHFGSVVRLGTVLKHEEDRELVHSMFCSMLRARPTSFHKPCTDMITDFHLFALRDAQHI